MIKLILTINILIFVCGNLMGQSFTKITSGIVVSDGGDSYSCSWGDYDNDGYPDLFVCDVGNYSNRLYSNDGDATFTKITSGDIVSDVGASTSSSWGDYNNDGYLDLFVANHDGQNNFLYRNNGNSTFTRITTGAIVNDGGTSYSCSWGDYDNDGYLDLFVANDGNNFLYHNNGNSSFTKITTVTIVSDGGNSWGCNWSDYDNDGYIDLFVANRADQNNFLYRNNGDGTFTQITSGAIVTDGGDSFSASWGDYDNDDNLDIFVGNRNQNDFLYRNNGNGSFTKITTGAIVSGGANARGSSWCDYDNDGDLDLFVVNIDQNNFLYQNDGSASFTKITSSAIITDAGASNMGCSWCDYDNDGDSDIFIANGISNENNCLFANNGNSNNWINIKCVGTASNTSAIGARLKIKATINGTDVWQMHQISGQTGWCGQNSLNAHLGLGDATQIDSLRIEWPSGTVQIWENIPVNQFLTAIEGSAELPVELTSFTIQVKKNIAFLNWQTASEKNNYGFEIQRAKAKPLLPYDKSSKLIIDDWTKIAFIDGYGTCNSSNDYSFVDAAISGSGIYYYRLKQIDLNGAYKYSQEIKCVFENTANFVLSQNYPNPFNPITIVRYQLPIQCHVNLLIYNILGSKVRTLVNEHKSADSYKVCWDGKNEAGEKVAMGLYFYQLTAGDFIQTKKMLLIE